MCDIQCQRGYHAYPATLTGKLITFPLLLTELQVGISVKLEQNKPEKNAPYEKECGVILCK
jgi:hypothetical protein